jgi:hypothetical protein
MSISTEGMITTWTALQAAIAAQPAATCCVYWLYNDTCDGPENSGYVGITSRPKKRMRGHRTNKKYRNEHIHSDFERFILFRGTRAECSAIENQLRPQPGIGWNKKEGGATGRERYPASSRAKISASNKGKIRSEATRAEISARLKGKPRQKYKMKHPAIRNPIVRLGASATLKRNWAHPIYREKQIAALKNRHRPGPTGLYRIFNSNGLLLKMAISPRANDKLAHYKRKHSWWCPQSATISIEQYPTRAEAEAALKLALEIEQPVRRTMNYRKYPAATMRRFAKMRAMKPLASEHAP